MLRVKNALVYWVIGAGVSWFFFRNWSRTGGVGYDDDALNAATRTLLAETSFARPQKEMIGVLQVGVNRSKKGVPLVDVFTPPGEPNWNGSRTFKERWNDARSYPQWDKARAFTKRVLDGEYPNPIGDRVQFLHPRGMPRCNDGECPKGRVCVDTVAGKRCLPRWSLGANVKVIDGARFS